ncbi:tetratricopeptide repeat protein [Streptomyces sp. PB17]|uniref:tetratricopeptide repeat protein n=1 Tax=Streptomyces sp. PB17 TaxID=3384158 RepID=UPI0038B52B7B
MVQVSRTGGAIASEGGTAISGYVHELTVVQQAAPRERASWPHQVGVIPPRAQSFQHRAEVEQMRAAVAHGGTAVLCQVLTGTGGVGKTQLAADYARASWESGRVDVLVWITASTSSAAVSGYAQAGVEVLGADPQDPEQAAKTFLAWLEPKPDAKPCRWLVVLDDLADPADLRGLWPPTSPSGRTLVTTRRRDAALTGSDRRLVTIGLFTPDEAAAYLTASLTAHHRHEPVDQVTALAADLGHLPLALAQAAAYLIDSGLDCAAYRQLLADRARTLTDVLPEPDALPDDQATTVAAAWSLSIERADRLHPAGLARPMLQLVSMLDPNGIPQTLLTSGPALRHLTRRGRPRTEEYSIPVPPAATVQHAVGALRALHRLSLIDHTADTAGHAVRVHQLIQRATYDSLAPSQRGEVARTAADALEWAWPHIERDSALAQALRSNATVLADRAGEALYRPSIHPTLYRLGRSLGESSQVAAARDQFQRLTDTATQHLGADHHDTLKARYELALWQGESGDATGAVAALEEVLADELKKEELVAAWLKRPPGVRRSGDVRYKIAEWQGRSGDATGAVAAFEALLADQMRAEGANRSDALSSPLACRYKIAEWRGESGDVAGALAALEELLPDQIRTEGADHPNTLVTRHSMAYWMGSAGDAVGALAAFEELLADRMRILGADHPQTLITRHAVAYCIGSAGDAAGAVAALEALLADQMRIQGTDHRETLNVRHSLALRQGEAGDPAGAVAALGALLADQMRVLGTDHPYTLATRRDLNRWRGATETPRSGVLGNDRS